MTKYIELSELGIPLVGISDDTLDKYTAAYHRELKAIRSARKKRLADADKLHHEAQNSQSPSMGQHRILLAPPSGSIAVPLAWARVKNEPSEW